jgi:2'-5' RNA ligase
MVNYADYLIVLSPPKGICEKIEKHKLEAAEIIGKYDSMHSKAHISIKDVPMNESFIMEQEMETLKSSLKLLPPIALTIDGFDVFAHGNEYRTIYAKLQSNQEIGLWFKTLKKHINLKSYFVPHITIAKNIHVTAYNQLWPHFNALQWVEDFEVKQLTVLQREPFNNSARWKKYLEIPFEGQHLVNEAPVKPSLLKPLSGNYSKSQQISLF